MNEIIKSGFLDTIFSKNADLQIDYDFRTPSFTGLVDSSSNIGYLLFNNQNKIISAIDACLKGKSQGLL